MNNFVLMARFNGWNNALLYESVATLPEQVYRKEQGAFFGSVHRTLNHLLVLDRVWTGRIRGQDHGELTLDEILYEDLQALGAARREEDGKLVALVEGLSEQQLGSMVTYRRIVGEGTQETRCDHILLTLYNHQTHHRGQVHTLLTQNGVQPPPLDVGFFLEEIGLS